MSFFSWLTKPIKLRWDKLCSTDDIVEEQEDNETMLKNQGALK